VADQPKTTDENDPTLRFVPLIDAMRAPAEDGTFDCYVNRWWVVHPQRGLVLYRGHSPQCNAHESIARRIAPIYPWAEVQFIQVAYLPHECDA